MFFCKICVEFYLSSSMICVFCNPVVDVVSSNPIFLYAVKFCLIENA